MLFTSTKFVDNGWIRTFTNNSGESIVLDMQNNTFTFNKTTYIINRTDRFDYEMSTSMAFDGDNVIFSYAQGTVPYTVSQQGGGKYKFKGKTYKIRTGKRGGKFIMSGGKKVYI